MLCTKSYSCNRVSRQFVDQSNLCASVGKRRGCEKFPSHSDCWFGMGEKCTRKMLFPFLKEGSIFVFGSNCCRRYEYFQGKASQHFISSKNHTEFIPKHNQEPLCQQTPTPPCCKVASYICPIEQYISGSSPVERSCAPKDSTRISI